MPCPDIAIQKSHPAYPALSHGDTGPLGLGIRLTILMQFAICFLHDENYVKVDTHTRKIDLLRIPVSQEWQF